MTQKAVQELLESTRDPAYSVDEEGLLSGWNDAAERFLGYPREEVVGRPCCDILRGRDVFGNPYCKSDCPLLVMARERRPVRHFQMEVYGKDEVAKRVLCQALMIPGSTVASLAILHLLRPLDRPLSPWPPGGRPAAPP
ncbi:MAG: PAS domain-containing protein [Thermoanaerobaculia bacterium]|nr:PAS domain-containing protein [Thermoanaerobaculia bacterium]